MNRIKDFLKALVFTFFIFYAVYSCKKEETSVPLVVITSSVDNIFNTHARVGGKVSGDGGSEITERGVFWGTSSEPEKTGTKLQIGVGSGVFYDTLRDLTSGTKYYVKAYAVNKNGISYGAETNFTTQISLPTVSTLLFPEISPNSARIGGVVSDSGGFQVLKRGVFWGKYANPQLTGIELEIGNGTGEYSSTLTDLNRAVTYHVVAFASNIKGTAYGNEMTFTTEPEIPVLYTKIALDINSHSAKVGGEIVSDGGSQVTERGIYWGTSAITQTSGTKLQLGMGTGTFSQVLENLNPAITYYFRAYAVNAKGISLGSEESFTTLGSLPVSITLQASDISSTGVTISGSIKPNYLSTAVTFEYGTTTTYGSEINASAPVTKDDTVSVKLTGLIPATTYHFRVKAVNSLGTAYGQDSSFTTVLTGIPGTVKDIEGNTYSTIGIGYQVWMTENLKTTKYNDGTAIPLVDKDTSWAKLITPAYCWYNNDKTANKDSYGAIYNWFAINDKLCPAGWHVPSNAEITELINYLGGSGIAGGNLKEIGFNHWNLPNTGATNKYGFNAFAGGRRLENGNFDYLKVEGNWWTSSNYSTLTASYLNLLFNYGNAFQAYMNKKTGMSVRCVKNQ